LLRIGKEPIAISGRLVGVAPAKCQDPAVPLQRQHQAAAAALGCLTQCPDTPLVNRHVVRHSENRRAVPDIDLDHSLLGLRSPNRFQQSEGEAATPRSINDKICPETLAPTVAVFEPDSRDGRPIRRYLKTLSTAMREERDIWVLRYPLPYGQLDQWPGH